MSLQTPLGKVLGHGSAGDGTDHWWGQRVSGAALAILGIWLAVELLGLGSLGYADARAFVADPLHGVLLVLFCLTVAYHSYLGVQVVVEDYVHGHGAKVVVLVLSRFAHVFVAALTVYTILRIGLIP